MLVADGTYSGDYNRDIEFMGKAIVVMSENGPENCIIDCGGSPRIEHRGFYFRSGEDSTSVLRGFTITDGYVLEGGEGAGIACIDGSSPTIADNILMGNVAFSSLGGAISCRSSSPRIINNTISGNYGHYGGGGIYCVGNSFPTISHNVIAMNGTGWYGGGIYCYAGADPKLTSNTIVDNSAWKGGGISKRISAEADILNCILWGNSPNQISSGGGSVTYSDIQGGWTGEGNINRYPWFVLSGKQDYRLLWSSPCIDTGHPDSVDTDGTRSDMGAHFFDQNDFLTLYMTPDTVGVERGGELGVTYTFINRWEWAQPLWGLSQATLPGGGVIDVLGPEQDTLPAHHTARVRINHHIPPDAPLGRYGYWAGIGLPPAILFDEDDFDVSVIE